MKFISCENFRLILFPFQLLPMIAKAFRINALLEAIRGGVAIVGNNFSLVVFFNCDSFASQVYLD